MKAICNKQSNHNHYFGSSVFFFFVVDTLNKFYCLIDLKVNCSGAACVCVL